VIGVGRRALALSRRDRARSVASRSPHDGGAEPLGGDLHGADVVVGVFGSRSATAARHQVIFKGRRCRPIERIHHVGFSDLAQLGRALIAI